MGLDLRPILRPISTYPIDTTDARTCKSSATSHGYALSIHAGCLCTSHAGYLLSIDYNRLGGALRLCEARLKFASSLSSEVSRRRFRPCSLCTVVLYPSPRQPRLVDPSRCGRQRQFRCQRTIVASTRGSRRRGFELASRDCCTRWLRLVEASCRALQSSRQLQRCWKPRRPPLRREYRTFRSKWRSGGRSTWAARRQ